MADIIQFEECHKPLSGLDTVDNIPYLYDLSILGMEDNLTIKPDIPYTKNETLLTGRRYHYPRKRLKIQLVVAFVAASSVGK